MTRWAAGLFMGLACAVAHAEGGAKPRSSATRLMGVSGLANVPGGVVSLGGPALSFLEAGGKRWRVLREVPGDRVYRVGSDEAGRLLVAWSNEPLIHVYSPAKELVASLPKPVKETDLEWVELDQLELAANGRDALVFMLGSVRASSKGFTGPSFVSLGYRIALDGKSPAQRLFRADHAVRLSSSRAGMVLMTNKVPGRKCDASDCLVGAIVGYPSDAAGARPKTLLAASAQRSIDRAQLVRSAAGRGERATLLVATSQGGAHQHGLLSWRPGDAKPAYRVLASAPGAASRLYLTRADELVELRRLESGGIEVWRHGDKGADKLAALAELTVEDPGIYGVGELADGRLWVHYGDHLALLAAGQPPRGFSLAKLLPSRDEWAGAVLQVEAPTAALWLGIESGDSRYYQRVELAAADRGARPWPLPQPPKVARGGAESVGAIGADPKDPSTADRVRGAVTVRPYRGGLMSFGGPTLRILRDGDKRWLKVHTIAGDDLYRVTADDDGRLLAAWENDPAIHLFTPATGAHVAIPRPAKPADFYDHIQVDELFFLPGGREALVFMEGNPVNYSYLSTLVYRVALDGKTPPRLILRVDEAERLFTSARGAIFVLREKPPLADCNHLGCWPVSAIVACELPSDAARAAVTVKASSTGSCKTLAKSGVGLPDVLPKKYDLQNYQVHLSSTLEVRGSSDAGIAAVVGLVQVEGKKVRNGGRALLRWRWGQERAELRALTDNSSVTPRWLLTRAGDFVEMRDGGDNQRSLLLRFTRKNGSEDELLFPQLEKLAGAYGLGERQGGGLWVHYGDFLGLVAPDGSASSVNISSLLGRKTEWAGTQVYVAAPESIWFGIDGRGRDLARIDLAAAQRRARKWR